MLEHHNSTDLIQLVTFKLGEEEYGVDILKIQEVNKIVHVTNIPNSPPHIAGVVNLRGKIIPVVNLRKRFGMPYETGHDDKIMVVDIGTIVGLIVDSVSEVLRIPANTVDSPPNVSGEASEYVCGIGKLHDRLLLLLDIEKLLGETLIKDIKNIEEKQLDQNELVFQ